MSVNIITDILKAPIDFLTKTVLGTTDAEDKKVEDAEKAAEVKEESYENLSLQDFKKIVEAAATDENGLVEFIEKNGVDAAFKALDENGDGTIQTEEVSKVLDNGSSNSNFSVLDLVNAVVKAVVNPDKTDEKTEEKPEEAVAQQPVAAPADFIAPPAPSSNYGGGNYSGNTSYDNTAVDTKASTPKTVEEYKAEITQKESDKNQVKQSTATGIQEQEQKITEAMTQENSGIPKEVQAEYEQQRAELETKIGEQATEIEKQNGIIQESTAKIASCDTAIGQIDGQISSLKTQLSGTSSTEDSGAKDRISGKIRNLENAKKKLEDEKTAAEKAKQTAEQAKQTAEQTKADLEKEKDGLMDAILEKYKDAIPAEVKQIIETAKAEIQNLKAQETEKIGKLDSEIQTLKTEMSQLERKQSTDKVIGENTEGLYDKNGKRIAPIVMPQTAAEWAKYGLTSESAIASFKKMQPKMQEEAIDLIDFAMSKGYTVKVNSSYRSNAAQRALYEKELRSGGPILAAKPGTSQHERGLAIDIRVLNSSGQKDRGAHRMLGAYWESKGHFWLGRRATNPEDWHFDMRNG